MASQRMGARQRLEAFEDSIHARSLRVRARAWMILQIATAAGLAYWVAQGLFDHKLPFFAPISVVIILSFTGGDRIRKAFDLSLGCVGGVLIGDLMSMWLGAGAWQIAIIVAISLLVASFATSSQLVNNQVAIGSILIATIMPPGAENSGLDRTMDALVGCVIGLLTLALLPSSPLVQARREAARVLGMISSVLDDTAEALRSGNETQVTDALKAARGSQKQINAMSSAAQSGRESTQLSPLLWSSQRHVRHLERVVMPVDNGIRNVRVLARRALVLVQDHDYPRVTSIQLEVLDELADIALILSDIFAGRDKVEEAFEIPDLVRRLRVVGSRVGMEAVGDNPVLSNYALLAQTRSIITDLLEVCGMSRESAVAVLVPTSQTPAFPPEITED